MVSTHGYVAAAPPLGAADTGGQVVYVLEMSKKLASLGYDVDIWTRRFEGQPESERVAAGVRIVRVPCGPPVFLPKEYLCDHLPEWSERALERIRREGLAYHFVNSHYWDAGFAAGVLCRELGVAHIHTPHSLGIWKQRQMEADYPSSAPQFEQVYNFRRRIQEERRIYAEADRVVATSGPQLDILARDYGVTEDKIRLAPPGCDETRFFPVSKLSRRSIRRRLGFSGRTILAIGRLARNKGYDLLIDAFARLAAEMPDANLHLAVGGEALSRREAALLAELQERARQSGYPGRIRFGSFIPDDELADFYRAADLFVLSSRYEPFGMTAIEAMASGTPTIITVHGGLRDILVAESHVLFADPFKPQELAKAMARVLHQPSLGSRLSSAGAQISLSLFTWTATASRFLAEAGEELAEAVGLGAPESPEATETAAS